METASTKDRLLFTSIKLFAEQGYDKVSMRHIAAAVGIKAASIYNHFPSKRSILCAIYEYYDNEQNRVVPKLDELMKMTESASIHDIYKQFQFKYSEEVRENIASIMIIAGRGINGDENNESARFINDHFIGVIKGLVVPTFNRLVELKRVQPFDVDGFASLLATYGFTTAFLSRTPMTIDENAFVTGLRMIFSAITIIPQGDLDAVPAG